MELNNLIYQQTQLYREAEQCESRKDALNLIRKATRLQDTIDFLRENEKLLSVWRNTYQHNYDLQQMASIKSQRIGTR